MWISKGGERKIFRTKRRIICNGSESRREIRYKNYFWTYSSFNNELFNYSFTLGIPHMILGETALSFLGLGIRPPAISWETLMQDAQNPRVVAISPGLLIPAFFVIITILAFNFIGDGVRDAADPYHYE